MIQEMKVTIVGGGIIDILQQEFDNLHLNQIKPVKEGTLGNFNTLTYTFGIEEEKVLSKRRELMNFIAKESTHLVGMYRHGGWMDIFVFKKTAFKL